MDNKFVWGVATAATQIEGAAYEGGKGLTNWDVIPTRNGATFEGQGVTEACDHYHRWKEDIALIKELGVKAYRFSINWARILPNGVGDVNQEGIQFYSDLIDELLRQGIEPYITLFHWDFPYELYKKGAWLNDDVVAWFSEYTKVVAEYYADRVKYFITINEPQCILTGRGGTVNGAPYTSKEKLQMVHNLLLCHGHATRILHEYGAKVGYAPCGGASVPYTNSEEDIAAARKHYFRLEEGSLWSVPLFSDPVIFGEYPESYYKVYKAEDLPNITEEDMKIISTPIDFYCQNIYSGQLVKAKDDGYEVVKFPIGTPMTCMDWFIEPRVLYWGPKFLYERYKKPFFISENGCAVTDIVSYDDKVHDGGRIEYLKQHIDQFLKAKEDGVDARGYFLWSLMDNFEWAEAYSKRFGIIYVDYATQKRIKKDSFYYYQQLIKEKKDI